MLSYWLYFFLALVATTLGATAGLGGGIIIKPVLSLLSDYPAVTINLLSAITVFTMALVTTSRRIFFKKEKILDVYLTYLIIGSVIGGIIGASLFSYLTTNLNEPTTIITIQSIVLLILLIIILLASRFKISFKLKRGYKQLIISGLLMGIVSAFLGIGGGPINVIILLSLFSYNIKDAVIKSTLIILFAQLAAIITTFIKADTALLDLSMLIVMVPGAIIGGLIGSRLVDLLKDKVIATIFKVVIISLIIVTIIQI